MMGKKARFEAIIRECDLLLEAMSNAWFDTVRCSDEINKQIAKTINIRDKVIEACKETGDDIFDETGFMSKATAVQLRGSMMKWLVAMAKKKDAAVRDGGDVKEIEMDMATIRDVILMIGEWEGGKGRKKLDQVYEAFDRDKIEVVDD